MREKRRNIHSEISARNQVLSRKLQKLHEGGNPLWTVVGGTSIGKKAEELREKSDGSSQAGFLNNPRFVLPIEFFEKFRERSKVEGLPPSEKREAIFDTSFSESEIRELLKLVKKFRVFFGSIPFVARSSPPNDCRGTGVYDSEIFLNLRKEQKALQNLIYSVKCVLAGEFNLDALALSNDLGWDSGMAVVIEPIVGQFFPGRRFGLTNLELVYGPKYGGQAHTSRADGKRRLYVSPGLPTRAVKGKALEIGGGILEDWLSIRKFSGLRDERLCCSSLESRRGWTNGEWIAFPLGRVKSPSIPDVKFDDPICPVMFEALERLEELFGPQYVEFAIPKLDDSLQPVLLQIADIKSQADFYAFPESGKSIMECNFVVGSGRRDCNGIVIVEDMSDVIALGEYNDRHKDYLLIFSGDLVTCRDTSGGLRYFHLNNASVLVELYRRKHVGHPISHFEGAIEESEKLFLVGKGVNTDNLKPFEMALTFGSRKLTVYDVPVRVTASEKRQKAIVEIIE